VHISQNRVLSPRDFIVLSSVCRIKKNIKCVFYKLFLKITKILHGYLRALSVEALEMIKSGEQLARVLEVS